MVNRVEKDYLSKYSSIDDLYGVELENRDIQIKNFKNAELIDYYPIETFKYAYNYDVLLKEDVSDLNIEIKSDNLLECVSEQEVLLADDIEKSIDLEHKEYYYYDDEDFHEFEGDIQDKDNTNNLYIYYESQDFLEISVNNLSGDFLRVENSSNDLIREIKSEDDVARIVISYELLNESKKRIGKYEDTYKKYRFVDCYKEENENKYMPDYKEKLIFNYKYDLEEKQFLKVNQHKDYNVSVLDLFGTEDYYQNKDHIQTGYIVFIKILKNELNNNYYYIVDEPHLDENEEKLRDDVIEEIGNIFRNQDPNDLLDEYEGLDLNQSKIEFLKERLKDFDDKYFKSFSSKITNYLMDSEEKFSWQEKVKIMYYLSTEYVYYKELTAIMEDKQLEEINVNGSKRPVFVNHEEYGEKDDCISNIAYEEGMIDSRIQILSKELGKSITKRDPAGKGELRDGSRFQGELGEGDITDGGGTFTIRKFQEIPFTPRDLIGYQTFNSELLAFLWYAIDKGGCSAMVCGGTASGKTTATNVLTFFFQPQTKVITIEDTRELTVYEQNKIHKKTKTRLGDAENVDMGDLLVQALRERPEYLIIGEVRAEEEANKMTEAANTGHQVYTTFHADSVGEAVNRLSGSLNVGKANIKALDLVIFMEKDSERGKRVSKSINEFTKYDSSSDVITSNKITKFKKGSEPEEDTFKFSKSKVNSKVLENDIESRGTEEFLREINNREGILKYLCRLIPPRYEIEDSNRQRVLKNKFELEREIIKKYTSNSSKDVEGEKYSQSNIIIDLIKTGEIFTVLNIEKKEIEEVLLNKYEDKSQIKDILNDIKIPQELYKEKDKFEDKKGKYEIVDIERGREYKFDIKYYDEEKEKFEGEKEKVDLNHIQESKLLETRNKERLGKLLEKY